MTNTNGNLVYKAQFDPHGQALAEWSASNNTNLNTKKFAGYEQDAATGLDYAVGRTYKGNRGRFMQPDPAGMKAVNLAMPQSLNLYSYGGNDPVNHIDPSGFGFLDWIKRLFGWLFGNGDDEGNSSGGTGDDQIRIEDPPPPPNGGDDEGGPQFTFSPERYDDCVKKYLPGQFPGGKSVPSQLATEFVYVLSNRDSGLASFIMAIWAKESNFDYRPTGDHGLLQLTSWWRDYSDRNHLDLIVPVAYDTFARSAGSPNRNRRFEGSVYANLQTGINIVNYQSSQLGMTYNQIAYNYGPGPEAGGDRAAYRDEVMRLRDMYSKFLNCLNTGE